MKWTGWNGRDEMIMQEPVNMKWEIIKMARNEFYFWFYVWLWAAKNFTTRWGTGGWIRRHIRVCQYAKGLLISSSSSGNMKSLITRHLPLLFFFNFIFRFFSACKDCQKYMYFQRLYPVLLKMRLICHLKNYIFSIT